ncbi:odorant receptor 131-2-like [Salarias fasciatus]|uniref:odorant receptor 131-2-like n=1 Tax=Salarias fasciatus TaxID=181472 RepID=UPI0011766944|nr:odorant receptor 131-2-like [Salarias fasciatus]
MSNVSVLSDDRSLLERAMIFSVTTVPCCVFLFVNCTMLFSLRSKAVFKDTCRYVLLYNLLLADTMQLVVSQVLYILAVLRLRLTYPLCGFVITLSSIIMRISPLTLVVMSFDRYVAVCYPLRHATIVTMGKTRGAICVIWAISSVNVFSHISLLRVNPFEGLNSLQMEHVCSMENMLLSPVAAMFDQVYEFTVFISAGVSISFSYIGVLVAARSASTDKVSARKAHKTLLLQPGPAGPDPVSTIVKPVIIHISQAIDIITLVPKCLSPLIYGLGDQTIRPVLLHHLFCQLTTISLHPGGTSEADVKPTADQPLSRLQPLCILSPLQPDEDLQTRLGLDLTRSLSAIQRTKP